MDPVRGIGVPRENFKPADRISISGRNLLRECLDLARSQHHAIDDPAGIAVADP